VCSPLGPPSMSWATGGFAWEQHRWPILLIGFLLCGLGIGFAVTPESTVAAQLLPERLRSNGFGVVGLRPVLRGPRGHRGRRNPLVRVLPHRRVSVRRDLDDPVGWRLRMAASTQSTTRTRDPMTADRRSIEHHSGRKTMANPCAKAIASMTHPRKVDSDEFRNHKCHRPGDP
jgi:hypothetical protein